MSKELRKFPRLEEAFPISFEIVPINSVEPVERSSHKGMAKNISGGGLYLILPNIRKGKIKNLLDKTSKLSLEFYLPDYQNRIKLFAELCWVRSKYSWRNIFLPKWEMGVKFIQIKSEDRDLIIKYVINKQIEEHLINTSQE